MITGRWNWVEFTCDGVYHQPNREPFQTIYDFDTDKDALRKLRLKGWIYDQEDRRCYCPRCIKYTWRDVLGLMFTPTEKS